MIDYWLFQQGTETPTTVYSNPGDLLENGLSLIERTIEFFQSGK